MIDASEYLASRIFEPLTKSNCSNGICCMHSFGTSTWLKAWDKVDKVLIG